MKIKYIETERYKLERHANKALFGLYRNPFTHPPCVRSAVESTTNTNKIYWADCMIALKEVALPYEIDPHTLETLCYDPFGDQIQSKTFTAHPKVDPYTDELVVSGYEAKGLATKDIVIYALDKDGMQHDERLERLKAGKHHWTWNYDLPATFVIVPRRNTSQPSGWKEGEYRTYSWKNCMTIHTGGAWEGQNGKLYLESSRVHDYAFPFFPTDGGKKPSPDAKADFVRWEFDLNLPDGSKIPDPLVILDTPSEFPRMDERFMTKEYDFIFLNGFIPDRHRTKETHWYHAGDDSLVQEPVFIPRSADAPEGDGWVLAMVEQRAANSCRLVVLDTKEFEKPIAFVQLPLHVKAQVHGNWVSGSLLSTEKSLVRTFHSPTISNRGSLVSA
ncbi:hypothetical protein N7520_004884 [Penicillium odoratum]|uniref:uncharacterized protein n=1 Tax=Penicillium odoratum TaxID=1167516 RepID=UPI0025489E59|nr:uncharacterized protein N7520_004884 [Penicillium odoratum]KAJ5765325.1 hypothetical protein N7520_004884 [Penicillium odoratum]